jgi:hypothetical protein
LADIHGTLYNIYLNLGLKDLALEHFKRQKVALARAGPVNEENAGKFTLQVEGLEYHIYLLEQDVEQAWTRYRSGADSLDVVSKARLALKEGLGGEARKILQVAEPSSLDAAGARLLLELQLKTGQAPEVYQTLNAGAEKLLGAESYHGYRAQAALAVGDYALADRELAALQKLLAAIPAGNDADLARKHLTGQWDALALRGMVALETGRILTATQLFQDALSRWQAEKAAHPGVEVDFEGRFLAQGGLALLRRTE